MARHLKAWALWALSFLCACSTAIPTFPVQRPDAPRNTVLLVRPSGYQPVQLTREELQQGMRMLFSNGPLPGVPRGGVPRFILASADPAQVHKTTGYLQFCERLTGERKDCWTALNAEGGLDDSGVLEVALRFAFAEALEDAARAVRSLTPEQVRAILCLAVVGSIVQLLSPDPFTKALFIITTTNLIAFVGVDLFNNLVKGYKAMSAELAQARDFAQVRAAGLRYGERLGPTVARIVVMVATYGVAKFAGLFKGNALSLPGGQRAASLAESQGFRIPAIEGARSVALAANGTVAIDLGSAVGMAAAGHSGNGPTATPTETPIRDAPSKARFDPSRADHIFRDTPGHVNPSTAEAQARFARLFERVASDPTNLRSDAVSARLITPQAADVGVEAYTWVGPDGQVWVTVRHGLIENAGVNPTGTFR